MNCPYCDAQMQKGYIRSAQVMHWGKHKELTPDAQDIRLTKYFWKGFFHGFFVRAHHCPNCNKLLIALDEQDEE